MRTRNHRAVGLVLLIGLFLAMAGCSGGDQVVSSSSAEEVNQARKAGQKKLLSPLGPQKGDPRAKVNNGVREVD